MKKATTTYSLKAARALEAYDVLQIRTEKTKVDHRDRDGWLDLSTLRSDADFATATRYVTTLRVDAEYRVVSMNKRDVVLSMVAHEALTVKRTREVVRSFGLTMSAKRNSAGDFRINFPNGGEATAYYSNDLDEIVGTAKAMGDELIAHNAQRDREVAELKAQQARASRDESTRCVNCGELPADGHIQGCSASTKLCPGCGEMATLIPGIILTRENENQAIDYCVECWTIVEAGENGAGGVDVAGMRDVTLYARECTPLALGALTLNALDVLIGRLEAARDRATLAYAERAVEQLKTLLTIVRKHRDERIARMNAQRESVEREYQAAYDDTQRVTTSRKPYSVEHVERLAYGRAESYMRPLGATQTSDEYTGAGASQVLADEYEESVSADENDDASDDDFAEHDDDKLAGSMMDLLLDNRSDIEHLPAPIKHGETFRQAGTLTDDAGFVLTLANGTRVFVTIQVQ